MTGAAPSQAATGPYPVEVRFRERPALDGEAIAAAIRRRSHFRIETRSAGSSVLLLFPDVVASDEGEPGHVALVSGEGQPALDLEPSLSQTWDWTGAREVLAGAPWGVLLVNVPGPALDRKDRLRIVNATLVAVVETLQPAALHWVPAQRVVEPSRFLAVAAKDPLALETAINVRYFRVEDVPGESIMDTVGLAIFGLPDVQLRFTELDAGVAGSKVYSVARYIFDAGDVIADGHTVPGIAAGERWPCRHVPAAVAPERIVLEIEPIPVESAGT